MMQYIINIIKVKKKKDNSEYRLPDGGQQNYIDNFAKKKN